MSKGSDYCLQVNKGVVPSDWEELRGAVGNCIPLRNTLIVLTIFGRLG